MTSRPPSSSWTCAPWARTTNATYLRAKNEFGVRFVRSRPHSIVREAGAEGLQLTYSCDDKSANVTEEFDMVVLSTGFRIADDVRALAEKLGLQLNASEFSGHRCLQSGGHLGAGHLRGGHCPGAQGYSRDHGPGQRRRLHGGTRRGVSTTQDVEEMEPPPPEFSTVGEEPRVGVFICDCGENIGGVVDAAALAEFAGGLPRVVVAEAKGHGCSRQSMRDIQEAIREHKLNRVVIGGCSPRTHETKFQEVVRAGRPQ
jgi:heterodisulfide reductase subunit A2